MTSFTVIEWLALVVVLVAGILNGVMVGQWLQRVRTGRRSVLNCLGQTDELRRLLPAELARGLESAHAALRWVPTERYAVMLACAQTMRRGWLSAEDAARLGEAIPGAYKELAWLLNVPIAELRRRLECREVPAACLVEFGAALVERFEPVAGPVELGVELQVEEALANQLSQRQAR